MEMLHEEEPEPEPYASITRLVSRLRITRDKATILLIKHDWNEKMFDSNYLLSAEYERALMDIVDNPKFDYQTTSCVGCWNKEVCQNVGCGHHVCNRCILGKIISKVGDDEEIKSLICPFFPCGKFITHDFIKSRLSEQELLTYDAWMKRSYERRSSSQTTEDNN